ncbi:hypothetical protein [Mucilaginibacter lacusdianchii]|uniref:hypothetical protein n=1 Tax=Mucilaginibacter lacusdianchii TaxID=2684211 RepID=UPI00131D1FC5|nr:hypothetical protein [Mucilaginibacter sp. JXJ CY 39]
MKLFLSIILISILLYTNNAFSQIEVKPWGNITGIRRNGQLFEFETSIQLVKNDGIQVLATARERQRPQYHRNGNKQVIETNLDSLHFIETITEAGNGKAAVDVQLTSHSDVTVTGAYFTLRLPYLTSDKSSLDLINNNAFDLSALQDVSLKILPGVFAKGIEFKSDSLQVKVEIPASDSLFIRHEWINGIEYLMVYLPIQLNNVKKGETIIKTYQIEANGPMDTDPITLTLNSTQQGRKFEGLGGNFRLQNPATDPQVIDYSLANLRVAWSRVELPWRLWHPNLITDPTAEARASRLPTQVVKSMEMAQRLGKMGVPVILSAWYAPDWAIVGKATTEPVNGVWGNPLNAVQMQNIYKSITDYILYLKNNYGVEAKAFSFNESDVGINIRMTPQEHADFIKGLGAYMEAKGLKTKVLLGDNSDATTYNFIYPALNDPEARKYIAAVSFHSWRGWETETLQKWADAATQLQLPLLVGEGSIDAAAWQYPDIFQEPTYALEEINLYTRLLAICQPVSILQWQLTADYSPLAGGGIFGDNSPLRPTQRFWNLKQLALTPEDLYSMPITASKENVSVAALGDNSKGVYAIHLVNNGCSRKVVLTGLPTTVKAMHLYVTNQQESYKNDGLKKVSNGQISFTLKSESYVTLISEPVK